MPTVEAVNSFLVRTAPDAGAVEGTSVLGLTAEQIDQGIVASVQFELPDLQRVGAKATATVRFLDLRGGLNELTAEFRRVSGREVRVNLSGEGLSAGGTASFDIHVNPSGTIRGFDLEDAGRLTTLDAPVADLTGRGRPVELSFDDSRVGDFGFGFEGLRAEYLELLQGVGGLEPPHISDRTVADILGTAGNDVLTGTAANNTIFGFGGDDTLAGAAGDDTLDGGDGNDTLIGNAGADTLIGGDGTDTVDYSSDPAAVTVDLANGTATDGYGDTDTLSGIENVIGSDFDDTITGDTGDNVLDGGAGADILDGGGGGTDTLTGGAGDDTFVIHDGTTAVTITDFTPGNGTDDVIDLSDVAAIGSFGQLQAATSDDGNGNTIIDLGGGATLTLEGVASGDLTNADFTF